ncbi:MAG: hypothetical protein QXX64_00180 [Nitrososphaera sp.]|uniref:PsbP C-terminal domain-containing protein n=1 Tax=Nitrososphaera gargensis (strain Ga9.2) TaxID=1237085 RepID=K0IMX0_NITGG|nr:hypothetical protein [Candidatus Nitrososphaera gargensis]AFU58359.1 hypothetical protein Ngar_c14230 [Candidatus Nitrososphaera gargensis Ga9.2]
MVHFRNDKILISSVAGAGAAATTIVLFLLPLLSSGDTGITYRGYVSENNIYNNSLYKLSIAYPPGWKVLEDVGIKNSEIGSAFGTDRLSFVVVFAGPVQDNFATNINIETNYMQGMSLEEFAQNTEKSLASTFSKNNFTVLDKGHTEINGRDAYFITATLEMEQPIKNELVILERDNYAYIITYNAMATTFDDHIQEFEDSLSTFEFL